MNFQWRKLASVFILAALGAATAFACAWDYDTVPEELKGVPDVVDAVVGRLAINPPLYYKVRLDRVVKEMKDHPENLDLYDNAGVAADKLGDTDGAIAWMAKKAEQLKTSKLAADQLKDHQYRYHANLGTFYAHKWAKQEVRTDLKLLKKGIAELETAVKINPDAHFGREVVQIELLKLIVKSQESRDIDSFEREEVFRDFIDRYGGERVSKALIGIMLLGSGAESPDILYAIGMGSLYEDERSVRSILGFMILERIREINDDKDLALFSGSGSGSAIGAIYYERDAVAAYKALRQNAKEYRKNRDDFMNAKLQQGQHPDSDPTFWIGYTETPRVNLDKFVTSDPRNLKDSSTSTSSYLSILIGTPILIAAVIFLGILIRRRAK